MYFPYKSMFTTWNQSEFTFETIAIIYFTQSLYEFYMKISGTMCF
jgi:hypothetical protein